MCADYRAGATIDRELDEADLQAGRKVTVPLHFIWSNHGFPARTGDPLGWLGDASVWISLLFGAYLGARAYQQFGLYALIAPAAISGGLALITAFLVLRTAPPAANVPPT